MANQPYDWGRSLSHATCHFGEFIISFRRITALLRLPFNVIMLRTLLVVSPAGNSGMGDGSRSTVALKNLFTAFKLFLMKRNENKSNFIIISRTSLFKTVAELSPVHYWRNCRLRVHHHDVQGNTNVSAGTFPKTF